MKVGRRTKLTKQLIEKAATYVDQTKKGGLYFGDLPSIEGLAIYLDVARSSIYLWKNGDDELSRQFSDILENILTWQGYKLLNKGLKGEYNSTIVKVILTKHGYVEKSEVDQNLNGNVQFINDVPRPKNS